MFQKAERKRAKLRLGICGISGSGKTFSALLIAKGIGNKIAIVDTENHSAELYAGKEGMPEYDVLILSPPYETEKYIAAINEAEKAGYDVIILDSISHAWSGEGGLLDQQGKIADSGRGNSYTAWRNITPKHNKFIEKMLSCNLHLIATMRSKTEYALITNDKGKQEPKKMGLAPIQREGMDYEFTTVFDMDINHNAITSKDRTGLFDGKIFTPTVTTGKSLKAWLESGIEPPVIKKDDVPDFQPIQTQVPEGKATPSPILASQTANAGVISEAQGKRLYAISRTSEIPVDILKLFLKHFYNIEHSKDIKKEKYTEICNTLQNKGEFNALMGTLVSSTAA